MLQEDTSHAIVVKKCYVLIITTTTVILINTWIQQSTTDLTDPCVVYVVGVKMKVIYKAYL